MVTSARAVLVTSARTSRGADAGARVGAEAGEPAAAAQGREGRTTTSGFRKREDLENYSTRPRIKTPTVQITAKRERKRYQQCLATNPGEHPPATPRIESRRGRPEEESDGEDGERS